MDNTSFGMKLAQHRASRNLSLSDVAKLCGVAKSYIWEGIYPLDVRLTKRRIEGWESSSKRLTALWGGLIQGYRSILPLREVA